MKANEVFVHRKIPTYHLMACFETKLTVLACIEKCMIPHIKDGKQIANYAFILNLQQYKNFALIEFYK